MNYRKAAVVCYVNSSAEVKAESDICCTSANAIDIVNSLTNYNEVIFIPSKKIPDMIIMPTIIIRYRSIPLEDRRGTFKIKRL